MGQSMISLEQNGSRRLVFQKIFKDDTPALIVFNRIGVGTQLVMRVSETSEGPTIVVRKLLRLFRRKSSPGRLIRLERSQLLLELFERVKCLWEVFATKRFESGANKLSTFQCTGDLLRTFLRPEGCCLGLFSSDLCSLKILYRLGFLLVRNSGRLFSVFLLGLSRFASVQFRGLTCLRGAGLISCFESCLFGLCRG